MKAHPSVQQFNAERVLRTLILIALAAWLVLAMTGCSTGVRQEILGKGNRFDQSVAGKMLPGHYGHMQCEPYANALADALNAKGIPNCKIGYKWVTPDGNSGLHAVVLFEQDGAYWMMDNMRDKPKRVKGRTDLELCQDFSMHVKYVGNWVTCEYKEPTPVEEVLRPSVLKYLTKANETH